MLSKIKQWAVGLYGRFVLMDDSQQRIAVGFGVGVFLGILPGTGPLAALAVSWLLRLNKAATVLGAVLTNTWLSFVTFAVALKIGSRLTGSDWLDIKEHAKHLSEHFSWGTLWDVSLAHVLKPLLLGYAAVGLLCGLAGYVLVLIFLVIYPARRYTKPR